jgi:hypothetical protein
MLLCGIAWYATAALAEPVWLSLAPVVSVVSVWLLLAAGVHFYPGMLLALGRLMSERREPLAGVLGK